LTRRTKAPREERRRAHIELNLLKPDPDAGALAKARRGCTLPFLGGGLLVTILTIAFEVVLRAA
jgi:hypothetical protein